MDICFEEYELYSNIVTGDVYNELLKNNDICLDEVKQALNRVKPGKAIGVDQLSNEMLKCSDTLIIHFCTLCLNTYSQMVYSPTTGRHQLLYRFLKRVTQMLV